MTSIGIDLGTTNSVIARLDQGVPVAIPIDGSPIVPSVVLYEGSRVVVGREARNLELQHPERTVRSTKRKIGTDHTYAIDGRTVTPTEVSAEILRALRAGAEKALGERVRDVVVTVPAYFDDAQRRATLRAGELAGLNVLRLLNEPTSASLVYDQVAAGAAPGADPGADAGEATPELLLVYDLGGGTFDVSVLEVFEGVREVRATAGNTHLGGDDFDEKLVQRFLDELRGRGVDPREDLRAMARLRRVAETTKIALSAETQAQVREEFLTTHDGQAVHLDLTITRRDFEDLIEPLLAPTLDLARKALGDAGVAPEDLTRVCLVGGLTRIPRVRALLEEAFEADVHEEIDPDLAVGLGAAIQAGMLTNEPVGRILVDVTAHSMGIRVLGRDDDPFLGADTFAPVLRRNTVLPATRTEEFYTVIDDQDRIEVEVYQGENPRASENALVGKFDFNLRPAPQGAPVRVEFAYDLDGVVRVSVAQAGTDNAATVSVNVADAAPRPAAPSPSESLVERKARALLAQLDGPRKQKLAELLAAYEAGAAGVGPGASAARQAAEEALLDFFLDHDDGDGP